MKHTNDAIILGKIIRLAKTGKTQSVIAKNMGINPGEVYKICKRYGVKTKSGKIGKITSN